MGSLWQDFRHGMRVLARSPRFTLVSILMLAVGIAGATTMYSAFRPVAYRLPQVPQPHKLARLWSVNPPAGIQRSPTSLADVLDWRE